TIVAVSTTPAAVNEGQAVTVTGTFTDPGTQDTFAAVVNWGDGASSPATAPGHAFTATHVYDNNPAGAASGSFVIAVTVTDDDTGTGTGYSGSVVSNVAPSATLGNSGPVTEGGTAMVTFSNQSDPSSADTVAGFR